MSPNVTGWVLAGALLPWAQPAAPACPEAATAVLDGAAASAAAGEFDGAAARLRAHYAAHGECRELVVAAWSWGGWHAAEAAAQRGGTDEALTGVRAAIDTLGPPGTPASSAAYASAVLRASAAAAQAERDEMQLWLEHAHDLAATLALAGERARWPLPIDVVEGELWFRVHDYELAEASYTRALATRESPAAWRGLARARDRRGNRAGACGAYRRALDAVIALEPKGGVAAEARGYLQSCDR
jgi:hypothetical protein